MIADWIHQTPVLLVAVLVVFVPGAAALSLVGLRGLALLAAAPLFTVAGTAVIAVVFGLAGIPWSPLTWAFAMLALIALTWLVSRLLGGRLRPCESAAVSWWLPTAIGIGVAIGLWRLVTYITDPAGISQTNDAVFHMNAVRFIIETADASSMHVNEVIGGHSFYPAAWHGVVSLIDMATMTSVPIAANMLTLVIGAIIWTLGIAWLTRLVTGSDATAGSAAILSGALQTFPLLMFQWGVLFPNALSIALIPASVGVIVSLPLWQDAGLFAHRTARGLLLGLVAAAALALSQPAALLPWAGLVLVWFTARLIVTDGLTAGRRWVIIVGLWLALAAFWILLARGTSGSHWPPFRGKLEVFLDVLLNGQLRVPFAVGVSILMLWGLVTAWRSPTLRWFVVAWLGVSALYVLVAAVGAPLIRINVLGAWYADPYRIAALAPIVAIPLAAIGFEDLLARVLTRLHRRRNETVSLDDRAPAIIRVAALSVFMLVLVLARPVAMPAFLEGTFDRDSRYLSVHDSYLTPDERALLENLPDYVGPNERVLGNPSTGSGFGYMLSGIDVYPRTWSSPNTDAWTTIGERLRDAGADPSVCAALDAYGDPQYVVDFGMGDDSPGRYELPGMTDFAGQPGFEEVASVGEVSLWRITACAR